MGRLSTTECTYLPTYLGRWSTEAPTDADVAAGQQGAGSSVGHRVPHETRPRARSLT